MTGIGDYGQFWKGCEKKVSLERTKPFLSHPALGEWRQIFLGGGQLKQEGEEREWGQPVSVDRAAEGELYKEEQKNWERNPELGCLSGKFDSR